MSKKKTKFQPPRHPSGSHIDRIVPLNPKNPAPKPPGEKRGMGKPFIKTLTRSTIQYRLKQGGKVFTHHEDGPVAIMLDQCEDFVRDWIGLSQTDYLVIVKVCHSFVQDNQSSFFNHAR
jgi:hypothetical protein